MDILWAEVAAGMSAGEPGCQCPRATAVLLLSHGGHCHGRVAHQRPPRRSRWAADSRRRVDTASRSSTLHLPRNDVDTIGRTRSATGRARISRGRDASAFY